MSIGIVPSFKPNGKLRFTGDGGPLAKHYKALDKLAARAKVRTLSSFGDNREVPKDFDGDPSQLDDLLGPWNEWFDATDG